MMYVLERHLPPSADLDAIFPDRRRVASIEGGRTVFETESYGRFLLVVVPDLDGVDDVPWDDDHAQELLVQVLEFASTAERSAYVEEQGWGRAGAKETPAPPAGAVDLSEHFTRPNAPGSPVLDIEEPPVPPDPPEGGVYLHLWTGTVDPQDVEGVREGLREVAAHLERAGGRDVSVALRTVEGGPARVAVVSTWGNRRGLEAAVGQILNLVPDVRGPEEDVLPMLQQG